MKFDFVAGNPEENGLTFEQRLKSLIVIFGFITIWAFLAILGNHLNNIYAPRQEPDNAKSYQHPTPTKE